MLCPVECNGVNALKSNKGLKTRMLRSVESFMSQTSFFDQTSRERILIRRPSCGVGVSIDQTFHTAWT